MLWTSREHLQNTVVEVPDNTKVDDNTEYDLRIIVITFNRPKSLKRLLKSLNKAEYDKDRVVLEIWIDRLQSDEVHASSVGAAREFNFLKGVSKVYVQATHVGLRGQWLTTWKPPRNKEEIAVIFEDDLTVSPYFYRYLKLVRKNYQHRRDIAGFALQGTSIRHSDGSCCLNVPLENKVFLYPVVGTWGYSPSNDNWFKFIDQYQTCLKNNISLPLPENSIISEWYKLLESEGRGDTMWEHLYTQYTNKHNQWIMYSNFPGHRGLTFNWQEQGLHYSGKDKRTQKEEADNLLQEWTLELKDLPDVPVYVDNSGEIIQ